MEFVISQSKYGKIQDLVPDSVFIGYSRFRNPVYKIDVPDLDSLLSLLSTFNSPLIVDCYSDYFPAPEYEIEIYNDYRE